MYTEHYTPVQVQVQVQVLYRYVHNTIHLYRYSYCALYGTCILHALLKALFFNPPNLLVRHRQIKNNILWWINDSGCPMRTPGVKE